MLFRDIDRTVFERVDVKLLSYGPLDSDGTQHEILRDSTAKVYQMRGQGVGATFDVSSIKNGELPYGWWKLLEQEEFVTVRLVLPNGTIILLPRCAHDEVRAPFGTFHALDIPTQDESGAETTYWAEVNGEKLFLNQKIQFPDPIF